jgi:hypothetical protein
MADSSVSLSRGVKLRVDTQHETLLGYVVNVFCPPVFREVHTIISEEFLYSWHVSDTCDRRGGPNSVHNERGWGSRRRLTRRVVAIVPFTLRLLVMNLILLFMLDCSPTHRVNWRHDTAFVSEHLDFLSQGFLNDLNPVKMDGRRIDCINLIDTSESKFNGFLD